MTFDVEADLRRFWFLAIFCLACDDGGTTPDPDAGVTVGEAFAAGEAGALLSVWGPSAEQVYTVGGQPDSGSAWRFDGAAWAPVDVPAGPLLNWVHGADGEVWFVGDGGRALLSTGAAFQETETGVEDSLWGAFASAPDDVWAVGGDATCGTDFDPILIHFDGTDWSRVALPAIDRDFCALFKVWGAAANDVWAVGAKGVVIHWDGVVWSQVSAGTGQDLISLWGSGSDDIVAVGGRGNGVISRWDGATWTTTLQDREPGLNGVWIDADGSGWAAGNSGTILRLDASGATERVVSGTRLVLHGIFGFSGAFGQRAYAVGGSLLFTPPWDGVALEIAK